MWYKTKPTFTLNETDISQLMRRFSTHHEHSLNSEVKRESTWIIPESRLSLDRHRRKIYWAKACCSWVRKFPTNIGTTSKFYAPEAWHQASSIPWPHKYHAQLHKLLHTRPGSRDLCTPAFVNEDFSYQRQFISDIDIGHQQLVLHVYSAYNAQKIS